MMPGALMIGLRGTELTLKERELLAHPRVVGVILFPRNFDNLKQLRALVSAVHTHRNPPLLVAVDQEGGRVQRFGEPFTTLPAARLLGSLYDRDPAQGQRTAEQLAWLMAAELRTVGVDLSFAPVLDLDRGCSAVIGNRALHSDPDAVGQLGTAWARGMRAAGMAVTGKHFPGHGGVTADSHVELPVDGRPVLELRGQDMVPFERLIAENMADAVMPAHVVYRDLDDQPASFSYPWIQRILRQELGFQGVVVGDDLGMEGAASAGDYAQRAQSAAASGCDLIMLCNAFDATDSVLDALGRQVHDATEARLAALRPGPAPARDLQALRRTERWLAAREALDRLPRGID